MEIFAIFLSVPLILGYAATEGYYLYEAWTLLEDFQAAEEEGAMA